MPTSNRAMRHDPQIQHERGLAGVPGHARPARDSGLKSRAFGTKAGCASRFFRQIGESRLGLGLQQIVPTQKTRYGKTGRNSQFRSASQATMSGSIPRSISRIPTSCILSTSMCRIFLAVSPRYMISAPFEERALDSKSPIAIFGSCHKEHLGLGYLGYRSAHLDDGLAKEAIRRTHNGGFRPLELRTRCYCEHTISTHGSHAGAVRSRSGIRGDD